MNIPIFQNNFSTEFLNSLCLQIEEKTFAPDDFLILVIFYFIFILIFILE